MTSKSNSPAAPIDVEVEPLVPPSEMSKTIRAIKNSSIDAVKVTMTVELGRVSMSIKDLRQTRQGTVIPLDRAVGDPIDIRANGSLIARGEVVATEGNKYGIRVTEIVGPDDPEDVS
ncbi:MAG: flagellar motor switch protein FliN [Allgaiera sp.]|jgi:flagellar motor switch protein FliN/FliY|nr:flagellar motor switch protein FliN [Allgaiera sp.]